jgi:hypothetical protein
MLTVEDSKAIFNYTYNINPWSTGVFGAKTNNFPNIHHYYSGQLTNTNCMYVLSYESIVHGWAWNVLTCIDDLGNFKPPWKCEEFQFVFSFIHVWEGLEIGLVGLLYHSDTKRYLFMIWLDGAYLTSQWEESFVLKKFPFWYSYSSAIPE